jgi:hypothetical protein
VRPSTSHDNINTEESHTCTPRIGLERNIAEFEREKTYSKASVIDIGASDTMESEQRTESYSTRKPVSAGHLCYAEEFRLS